MWGQIGAALIGAASSAFGRRQQNKQAQKNAAAQMRFQERMSSTAYQRSMADMRSAGLNPMLAYSKGGASAPAGTAAPVINELGDMTSLPSTALAAQRLDADIDLIQANTNLSKENAQNVDATRDLIRQRTHSAKNAATISDVEAEISKIAIQALKQSEKSIKSIAPDWITDWFYSKN